MRRKVIIVEGPQGCGKTTLANYLRDNIAGSNLYRLSGQKLKTKLGKEYSNKMYFALLDYMKQMEEVPMDLIFDRTFFSEECYARLGWKEYSFTDTYEKLVSRLNKLNYNIYYISLYLKDSSLYEKRLAREHHHNYQAFSLDNSVRQQEVYGDLAEELASYDNIKVIRLAMDDFNEAYQKINELFAINSEN